MPQLKISVKIISILSVSLIVVEAVILLFSVQSERERILDHHRFATSLVVASIDPELVDDSGYLETMVERLSEFDIKEIRPVAGNLREGQYEILDEELILFKNGLAVVSDISGMGVQIRGYVRNIIGLTAIIVVSMVVTSFVFLRFALIGPLKQLLGSLVNISGKGGDLTQRLEIRTSDEIGEIAGRFNQFVEHIRSMVAEMKRVAASSREVGARLAESVSSSLSSVESISDSADSVRTGTETLDSDIQATVSAINEISVSIGSMAASVDTQANAVSDALAAIEEINASIHSMAEIASQKKTLSDQLLNVAKDGSERMDESVSAIQVIEESTNEMLKMIDVINTIAGQTNLLSINAAIEAAHAGDSGRGFAVVADEINKLSELTANHAKTITSSLKKNISSISSAGELNRSAGSSFGRMVGEIQEVVDAMSELVGGIRELSAATGEVVTALEEVDHVSEEVRRASKEINAGTQSIDASMTNVSGVSSEIVTRIEGMVEKIETIRASVVELSETGKENESQILVIGEAADQFVT